jgi:hypothetical protein
MKKLLIAAAIGLVTLTPASAHAASHKPKAPTATTAPSGHPTAKCKDGTFSHSKHRSGTCSHHGGVAKWYTKQSPATTTTTGTTGTTTVNCLLCHGANNGSAGLPVTGGML